MRQANGCRNPKTQLRRLRLPLQPAAASSKYFGKAVAVSNISSGRPALSLRWLRERMRGLQFLRRSALPNLQRCEAE